MSVKTCDFHPVLALSLHIQTLCMLTQAVFICFNLHNCQFQGQPGPRGRQGPKGTKGDQVRMLQIYLWILSN